MLIRDAIRAYCGYEGDDPVEARRAVLVRAGVVEGAAREYVGTRGFDLDRDIQAAEKDAETEEEGVLRISGVITGDAAFLRDYLDEDATSARDVRTALEGRSGELTVQINSPGGAVSQGSEIVEMLRAYRAKAGNTLTTQSLGIAASAASWVFAQGDKREMGQLARVMIHSSWAMAIIIGNASEVEARCAALVQNLRAADAGQIEMFAEILGKSEGEVQKLLDAETWYSASQAVEAGLATARMGEPEDGEPEGGGDHERRAGAPDEVQAEEQPEAPAADAPVAEAEPEGVTSGADERRDGDLRQIVAIQSMTL